MEWLSRATVLALLLTSEFSRVNSARILLVMYQWPSLIFMKVAIGEDLIRRGHEVYITVTSGHPATGRIAEAGIQVLQYDQPDHNLNPYMDKFKRRISEMIYDCSVMDQWQLVLDSTFVDCSALYSDPSLLSRARSLHFDMAVVEPMIAHPCYLILPHILGIPFIISTSLTFPLLLRIPALPSFYTLPPVGPNAITELNTFYGRLANSATVATFGLLALPMLWGNTTLLQQYAPEIESWYELFLKSEITIIENDHLLDDAMPLLPHVVTAAGCTARPAKPLPDNLEKIFEQSTDDGVILASFGSVFGNLRADTAAKFLDAFGRLKETVLIRMAVNETLKVPANVHIIHAWLPQNDILGHSKTRLFITHCGKNGQYEALYHGVPMLGIPLLAEQPWNCDQAKKRGIGLCLDILDFTANQLYSNIRELIDNATYRTNIQKLSEIWRDEPLIGREKAGFWIEHVIKYGANHLRSPAIDQPLYQFLMLDIVALIVAGVLLLIYLMWFLLKAIFKTANIVILKQKIE